MKRIIIPILLIATLMTVACNSDKFHLHLGNSDHDHEHEAQPTRQVATVSHTLFSEEYELHVEYPVLRSEKDIPFTAHITRLEDYKPVAEGAFIVRLDYDGDRSIEGKAEQPSSPGIFHSSIKPEQVGNHRIVFEYNSAEASNIFECNDIEVYAANDSSIVSIKTTNGGNEIEFLKEQAWNTDFGIQHIQKQDFREVISTSGQIMPANGDENTVVAPFNGIVSLKNILISGKEISKGQALLTLSSKGLVSDNISVKYAQLKTNLEKTKANYERLEGLVVDKIVSQKVFLEAKAEYQQARIAFENIENIGNEQAKQIRANQSGYVKNVLVSDGEFVEAGTALFTVAQNRRLILRADVSQNHWHCLPEINEANFYTPYDSEMHNTRELNGKLVSYSRNANNSSWSTPVFFEISNTGHLIPGAFIEVYLLSRPISDVIAIPKTALIEEQGSYYVFVQLDGETYLKREVTTGIDNGRLLEVTSGLEEGDIVVSRGAFQVKLGSMSASLPAHNHDH
jgi:RND family efflux transporter MFP subunit